MSDRTSLEELSYLLSLLAGLLTACGPHGPFPQYNPPPVSGTHEVARVTITPFLIIGTYAFSPDGRYLITDGVTPEYEDASRPPDDIQEQVPTTVIVLAWPTLDEIWRLDANTRWERPYAYHWSPDSREVWLSWFPDGSVIRLDIETGETATLQSGHAGIALAPDGQRLVA